MTLYKSMMIVLAFFRKNSQTAVVINDQFNFPLTDIRKFFLRKK